MKIAKIAFLCLLLQTLCYAQQSTSDKGSPDQEYIQRLVRLLAGLQKDPWSGWKTGAKVIVRYVDEPKIPGAYADVQPDLVMQVVETDKLVSVTQVVNGKPYRSESPISSQKDAEVSPDIFGDATDTQVEIDGYRLPCLFRERTTITMPVDYGMTVREWALASNQKILLRKEGPEEWAVTSSLVTKRVGDREYQCVEIKEKMTIYSGREIEVRTTTYLSPDIPGQLVEKIKTFHHINHKQVSPTPHLISHQKVVSVQFPE
jgi:hypothetical protein